MVRMYNIVIVNNGNFEITSKKLETDLTPTHLSQKISSHNIFEMYMTFEIY